MTVICAVSSHGETWIGSDTIAVSDGTRMPYKSKWSVCGGWAVGHAGNLRTRILIEENLGELVTGLVGANDFTNRIKRLMDADGFNTDTHPGPKDYGQQFILASRQGVSSICVGLSVIDIPNGDLWADGSGRMCALGADYAMRFIRGSSLKERVEAAVKAAIHYQEGCGGEPWIQKL